MNKESFEAQNPAPSPETSSYESLPGDHWFRIAKQLYKESGEIPDPLQIRAAAIIDVLKIPAGEASALETGEKGEWINPKKDRIIAQHLTNKAGVLIDKETGIVSSDFRDIYPDGLPEKLAEVLDPDTRSIMEIEYEHARHSKEMIKNERSKIEKAIRRGEVRKSRVKRLGQLVNELSDRPTNFFRLPGGVDLFLRGYQHWKGWQERHGEFFKKANSHAKVLCIEGFANKPFGESLRAYWSDPHLQGDEFYSLVHEAAENNFAGLFAEVDARDTSKVSMDAEIKQMHGIPIGDRFPRLPAAFYDKFFQFLEREHPHLAEKIGSPQYLQALLREQSISDKSVAVSGRTIYKDGKAFSSLPYVSEPPIPEPPKPAWDSFPGQRRVPLPKVSLEPTFLELGQHLFTDALAAIKLHLIAKLMTDGKIPKGPIIDYEGSEHLSSKSFFLRYPGYAMEVVLRTINELLAGKDPKGKERWGFFARIFKGEKLRKMYETFENPDWPEIVREIVRLEFKQVENDPSKTVAVGPNQRQLLDYPIDVLKLYNIDPEKVMPSDDEIAKIRQKFTERENQD